MTVVDKPRDALAFERDEKLYLVTPVTVFEPGDEEVAGYEFASEVKAMAPNAHLLWLRGQYVEADNPNDNGALWTGDELAIASMTPNLMPVTVMHDPRTAVGMIADTRLLTREEADVPRSRLDTTLGIWRHRFPEVAEEIAANDQQGSLMQSMECIYRHYNCSECGRMFVKLPNDAERDRWCSCLKGENAKSGENAKAARRLVGVCFTGTGLIFGTRGARGAFRSANLEVLQEEVAEFHQRQHRDTRPSPKPRRKRMDIEDRRYEELIAAERERDTLKQRAETAEEKAAAIPELEKRIETTEAEKVKAEGERDELKRKVDESDEQARAARLAGERMEKLGKGFTSKLGDFTRGRLEEQAKSLSDEEWEDRLKELEETAGVKRDEGAGDGDDAGGDTATAEETARSQVGGGGNGGGNGSPSETERRSVVAGIAKITAPTPTP